MSKRKTNIIEKAIVKPMGQVPKEKLSSKVKFGSSLEEVNVRNISLDGGDWRGWQPWYKAAGASFFLPSFETIKMKRRENLSFWMAWNTRDYVRNQKQWHDSRMKSWRPLQLAWSLREASVLNSHLFRVNFIEHSILGFA